MKKKLLASVSALTAAASLLLGSLPAMPASAEGIRTGKDLKSSCQYVLTPQGDDAILKRGTPKEVMQGDFGVPATEKVTQFWMELECDASQGLATMPVFAYDAPGYGEYDWYYDALYLEAPDEHMTIIFNPHPDYPVPNKIQLQLWGDDGKALDSVTIKNLGIVTDGGADIGLVSRRGDVNDDKSVTVADAVDLVKYLTVQTTELKAPANADMDGNNKLNAADLTLLKRGLLDGSLDKPAESGETAMEFVSHLRLGWNLGNTLDATGGETSWGCPFTTKDMIDGIKAAGFNLVRVPVTWDGHIGAGPDYKIDNGWMNRVNEVVDYVLDNGMYCILNSHHDTAWQSPKNDKVDQNCAELKAVWTQIANHFEHYDNHLIFETMNEPRLVGDSLEWTGGTSEARSCINKMNAAALEAMRATGGNNEKRFVMMPGHAASGDAAVINDIVLPQDDHIIVSVHAYTPYNFAMNGNGTSKWTSDQEYDVVSLFERLKSKFISKGVPVIIGEFGAINKNNEDDRAKWAEFYTKTASAYGVPCVWWDNNQFDPGEEHFGLFDRSSKSITYPKIMAALLKGTESRG